MTRALVVLAILLRAGIATGDDAAALVRDAKAAYADLGYVEALELLDRAWRAGGNEPAELRAIFALAGQAAGATGDHDAAVQWFARWLCLDRGADLPVGTSPKLTALVAEARASLAGKALAARATRDATTVELAIASDPLAIVAAARLGDARRDVTSTTAQWPARDGDIELLDRHGNVLARVAVERTRATTRAWYARWPTWAIASGSLLVAGGISLYVAVDARATIRSLDAESANHQYADVVPYETRFDRAQWAARIAFGTAAAAGVIGAVLWQRERGEHFVVGPGTVAWRTSF